MLKVNPKFQNLIPPLSPEEYAGLEQDVIATNGPREPIAVWNDTIVDGHHRFAICQKHGLPYTTREVSFSSEAETIAWMIKEQFNRRNMSRLARTILVLRAKDALIEVGRQRQGQRTDVEAEPHNTRKLIAERAGVSEGYVYQVDYVLQNGAADLVQAMVSEEMTVKEAYTKTRQKDEKLEQRKLKREEARQAASLSIPSQCAHHDLKQGVIDSDGQEQPKLVALPITAVEREDESCPVQTDPQEPSPAFAKASPEEQERIRELAVPLGKTPEETARFLKVERDADEETKRKLRKGDMSINEAYLLLTRPPEVTNLNAFDDLVPFEDSPDSFPHVMDLIHRAVDGFNVLLRAALGQYSSGMVTRENWEELEQVVREARSIPTKALAERMAIIDPQGDDGYHTCKQLVSDYEANANEVFAQLEELYTDEVAGHDLDTPMAETLCRVENKSEKLRIIMNRPLIRAKAMAQEASANEE